MLIDFANQIFQNEKAIDQLNQSTIFTERKETAKTLAFSLASPSSSNSANVAHEINRQENAENVFVTQSEFGGLADSISILAGRVNEISQRYENLNVKVDNAMLNLSLHLTTKKYAKDMFGVWFALNTSNDMVDYLQSIIAGVAVSNSKTKLQLNSLRRSVELLQNSSSQKMSSSLYGDEFIHLLDASVRDLRSEVREQRTWLGNQRRRIRQLEGTKTPR